MAPFTIGQSYGNNLTNSAGTPSSGETQQVPANSTDMTGTLSTANPETKPDANSVSAVAQNAGNLGPVAAPGLETTAKSPQQIDNPNLLGDVIEPEAEGAPVEDAPEAEANAGVVEEEAPALSDEVAPAEPDATEQPTEEAPQEAPSADVEEEPVAGAETTPVLQDAVEEESVDERFDPSLHTPEEVLAYLADADDEEKARVLQEEIDGEQRQEILGA